MENLIIFGARYLTAVMILIAGVYFLRQAREKKIEMVMFAIITLPAIFLISRIASLLYFNPRPFVVGNFVPLIEHANNNGFPSDHTLLSAAIAMVIFFYNKKLGSLLLFLALLVGVARILAGVHHALDIAGSFAIACTVAFLMYEFVLPKILNNKKFKKL
ncbi:MAG: undecaprenyl pyrophosphate phosphatase [uncultured bacterium]|nr:MAG: undecaprenyl pyrophosphate phosphatase [uncultured bacterium]